MISIPMGRAEVAALSDGDLDGLAAVLAAAVALIEDVRDERAPRSHCDRFDHPGHTWIRYGRPRYCWGDGPFLDRSRQGICGAAWPHPGHPMGRYSAPCAGVPGH